MFGAIWGAQRRQTDSQERTASRMSLRQMDTMPACSLLPPRITSCLAPKQTRERASERARETPPPQKKERKRNTNKTRGVDAGSRKKNRVPRGLTSFQCLHSLLMMARKTRSCPSCLQHKAWTDATMVDTFFHAVEGVALLRPFTSPFPARVRPEAAPTLP